MDSVTTELHHLAGLTAGSSITLRPGIYHFGEQTNSTDELAGHHAESLPFTLVVSTDGRVEFSAPPPTAHADVSVEFDTVFATSAINVDGQPATWLDDVRGATIDAGPSRFYVTGDPIVHAPSDLIPVPDRGADCGAPLPVWRGCGPRSTEGPSGDPFLAEIVQRVNHTRRALLAEQWYLHARHNETRRADHPHFATVAIAAGDIPWRPRFDKPAMISAAAASTIQPLHRLASAPLTADLRAGSLGIVGGRAQRLAAARHAVLALAKASSVDDLEIAVLASPERAEDWRWADALPHTVCASSTAAPVLVVDGVEQLEATGLNDVLSATGGIGAIVLAEDPASLPLCATVMFIDHASMAAVVDHRTGKTVLGATPLGRARDVARAKARALGDSLGAVGLGATSSS